MKKFPTIYLVRHAQTKWNVERRKQGEKNSKITEEGKKQINELARNLKTIKIDYLLTSPLKRSFKTATEIGKITGLKPVIENELRECSFGKCEGMTNEELRQTYPYIYASKISTPWEHRWPEGESYADLKIRVDNFLTNFYQNMEESLLKNYLLVAHSMINKVIIGSLLKLDPKIILEIDQPHEVIYKIEPERDLQYRSVSSSQWLPGYIKKGKKYG